MPRLFAAVLTSLSLVIAGCGGGDDTGASEDGGSPGGSAGAGGSSGTGGTGQGGSGGGDSVELTDLPGKIRFINFVSDGTTGVNLDLYWGTNITRGERVATVEYGEITEFLTPRRVVDDVVLDPDEARFFLVLEGDVSATPTSFLVLDEQVFTAETVLTVALAASDNPGAATLAVSMQIFDEAELSTPPADMAHVFGWSRAFDRIEDGDFVLVGAEGLCDPDRGDSGGANLGAPALIPDGTSDLSLFDANTDPPCDTGATPVSDSVEAGHSYVLLGEAETYELEARRTVILELGTQD